MTVIEIEAKKVNLTETLNTALEAAKVLTPATPEFDEAYERYFAAKAALLKIPDEVKVAQKAENADAIAQCAETLSNAISELCIGMKVANLIGEPVTAVRQYTDAEGKAHVVFNPVTKVSSKGSGTKGESKGRTTVKDAEGNSHSLTKFVQAHATEAELATKEFKYPHTRIDTLPKFDEFLKAHNLTGFTYDVPSTTEVTEAPAAPPSA